MNQHTGTETGLFLFLHTWCIAICGWAAPGGHGPIGEQLCTPHPLCDLAGGDGVLEVLPPCQGGTQQTQGLARARRALQHPIRLLQKQGCHAHTTTWALKALKVMLVHFCS